MTSRRLVALLAALTAASTTATALTPLLLRWPLLLAGLSPRLPFLLLASDQTPLPVFLLVATVRLVLADPIHFALGRRHGAERVHHRIQRVVRVGGLIAIAVKPNGPVMAVAGASGMSWRPVLLANVAGTVTYLLLLHSVGS